MGQRKSHKNYRKKGLFKFDVVPLKPLGAALSITGISIGMYMDFLFKNLAHWTTLFMIVALLLLVDWNNLRRFRFPSHQPILGWMLMFQFFMLLYATIRIYVENAPLDVVYLSYHLYIIGLVFAYSSNGDCVSFRNLQNYVFWTALPSVILGSVFCAIGLVTGEEAQELIAMDGDAYNIDMLTISSGALNALFSVLVIRDKRIFYVISKYVAILLSIYILLECNKRTPIFIFFLGCLYYLWVKRKYQLSAKFFVKTLFVVVVLVISYLSIEFVQLNVDKFVDSFYNGLLGLLGDSKADYSSSVEIRLDRRQWAYDYISNEFSVFNYIFGAGYLKSWLDFPILQSYVDMGIAGFLFYGGLVVLYPLRIIIKRIDSDNLIMAAAFTIYGMIGIFSTGNQYGVNVYVRVCLLAFVYYCYKKERHKNQNTYEITIAG